MWSSNKDNFASLPRWRPCDHPHRQPSTTASFAHVGNARYAAGNHVTLFCWHAHYAVMPSGKPSQEAVLCHNLCNCMCTRALHSTLGNPYRHVTGKNQEKWFKIQSASVWRKDSNCEYLYWVRLQY